MFVPGLRVIEDCDKFRYNVKTNRRLNQVAVARVFKKAGQYIFQLGIVNFLELTIINLLLIIHCFRRETQLMRDAELSGISQTSTLPFLRTHVSKSNPPIC